MKSAVAFRKQLKHVCVRECMSSFNDNNNNKNKNPEKFVDLA